MPLSFRLDLRPDPLLSDPGWNQVSLDGMFSIPWPGGSIDSPHTRHMAERRGVELCAEGASALETRMDLLEENLDSILERLDVVDRRIESINAARIGSNPWKTKYNIWVFDLTSWSGI